MEINFSMYEGGADALFAGHSEPIELKYLVKETLDGFHAYVKVVRGEDYSSRVCVTPPDRAAINEWSFHRGLRAVRADKPINFGVAKLAIQLKAKQSCYRQDITV